MMKLLFLVALTLLIAGCATTGISDIVPCVAPPPKNAASKTDYELGVKVAADLQKLGGNVGAELKNAFETELNANFPKMSDENVALYLFLNAITCYLKNGKVGEQVAIEMAATVRAKYGAKNKLMGVGEKVTPVERALIDKSSLATAIHRELRYLSLE